MALDQQSEEEKRKRREEFERNKAKLSLGGNQPAGFMGAGALTQAAPKAPVVQPARVSPQMATNIASSQKTAKHCSAAENATPAKSDARSP